MTATALPTLLVVEFAPPQRLALALTGRPRLINYPELLPYLPTHTVLPVTTPRCVYALMPVADQPGLYSVECVTYHQLADAQARIAGTTTPEGFTGLWHRLYSNPQHVGMVRAEMSDYYAVRGLLFDAAYKYRFNYNQHTKRFEL